MGTVRIKKKYGPFQGHTIFLVKNGKLKKKKDITYIRAQRM
jgi:hypothetical protein